MQWEGLVMSGLRPLTQEAGAFPWYIAQIGISESYLQNLSLAISSTLIKIGQRDDISSDTLLKVGQREYRVEMNTVHSCRTLVKREDSSSSALVEKGQRVDNTLGKIGQRGDTNM